MAMPVECQNEHEDNEVKFGRSAVVSRDAQAGSIHAVQQRQGAEAQAKAKFRTLCSAVFAQSEI